VKKLYVLLLLQVISGVQRHRSVQAQFAALTFGPPVLPFANTLAQIMAQRFTEKQASITKMQDIKVMARVNLSHLTEMM